MRVNDKLHARIRKCVNQAFPGSPKPVFFHSGFFQQNLPKLPEEFYIKWLCPWVNPIKRPAMHPISLSRISVLGFGHPYNSWAMLCSQIALTSLKGTGLEGCWGLAQNHSESWSGAGGSDVQLSNLHTINSKWLSNGYSPSKLLPTKTQGAISGKCCLFAFIHTRCPPITVLKGIWGQRWD